MAMTHRSGFRASRLIRLSDMDEQGECIHGIWPASVCTVCNGKDRKAETEVHWRTFPAKYAGQCAGCDLPINVGDIIAWQEGQPIYHEGCEQ